jgi:exopolysaccharide production protein ExoQ
MLNRNPKRMKPSAAGEAPARAAQRSLNWIRDDQYSWVLTAICSLIMVRLVIPGFFTYGVNDPHFESGQLYNQVIWWGSFAIALGFLLLRRALTWQLLKSVNPFFFAFVLYALLSVAWSHNPDDTIRRVLRMAIIVVVSLALCVKAWRPDRLAEIARPTLFALLAGSLVFGLMSPQLASSAPTVADPLREWHGLAFSKNHIGPLAAWGIIFYLHGWLTNKVSTLWLILGGSSAIACLVLSRSSTSLLVAMFASMLLFLLLKSPTDWHRMRRLTVSLFVIGILLYALAALRVVPGLDVLLDPVTSLTGKDATFTGRTKIWAIVREHISLHPWLGTGYAGYWSADASSPTSPAYIFLKKLFFYPGTAHNGYLDIINDLGFVGLVLFAGYIWGYLRQAFKLMNIDRAEAALYIAILFHQIMENFSESMWFSPLNFDFAIVSMATVSLARALLDVKLKRAATEVPSPSGRLAAVRLGR